MTYRGVDLSFVQAGSTTIEQIKGDKHVYRSFEAFLTLYLSLYKLYLQKLIEKNPLVERELREGFINAIVPLDDYRSQSKTSLKDNHQAVLSCMNSIDFSSIQQSFDDSLKNQEKFLPNYMILFELLLLFIRASFQQLWELHLSTLHELTKYFFAYDMQNYARLTPVYLSQMYSLKDKDRAIWDFFKN